jgi:hypothetical protein
MNYFPQSIVLLSAGTYLTIAQAEAILWQGTVKRTKKHSIKRGLQARGLVCYDW